MRIVVDGLVHTYAAPGLDDRTVLDIGRWEAAPGSAWLLHGVSGSGKTSLLNIIAGLLPPTQGRITVGDREPYALSEPARDRWRADTIGYVYQAHLLVPILSAQENIELAMRFGQGAASRSARRELARAMLEAVGLGDHGAHRPAQLSMGQRLRVAVARALVVEPAVVLADEPTASLDPANAAHVIELLSGYRERTGATLIVASHDPALDALFPARLALRDGRLVQPPAIAA